MAIGKIYIIKNSENSKAYIGKTFRDINKRFAEHLKCKMDDKFHAFVKNSDKSIFTISILFEGEATACELGELEMKYISEYDSCYNGYNSSIGGEGLCTELSPEVKQKMSIAHTGLITGEEHPGSKLTWKQVDEIRQNIDNLSAVKLAKIYNVSRQTINFILSNKTWKISEEEFAKYKKSTEDIMKKTENYLNTKLTWKQVDEIRENPNNLSREELAEKYNTSRKNIGFIIRNLSWKKTII